MSRALIAKLGFVIGAAFVAAPAAAQDATSRVLFTNVQVFNGLDDRLLDADVLVEDNMIVEVGQIDAAANARIIDGGGRTLMPGLIDSHVHFNMNAGLTIPELQQKTWEEIGARTAYAAREHFASGFTTVRDMCAMHDGLKKTIDAGYLVGPRIYLAGACIGQTGGHGDWGNLNQPKGTSYLEQLEFTRMVDGRAEVMAGVRRNFALGAHYVKIMVSGGVTSEKDPIDTRQMTDEEITAAVEVAESYNTYVAMHVHNDADVNRGLDLGVKVVDHGTTITRETAQRIKDLGAFWSPNTAAMDEMVWTHPFYQDTTSLPYKKMRSLWDPSQGVFDIMREVQPKVVFNSDFVLLSGVPFRQALDFAKWQLAKEIGNFEALRAMTSTGGELALLTGPRNPYPDGQLGVIAEGAYADILIVDGNPLEDITVIGGSSDWFGAPAREQPVETIRVIMKDGKLYKNTLEN
jgi:imidazolonepropionase-like amidohydrolase